MNELIQLIAGKLQLRPQAVETVLNLFEEGSTIPFIARYRKDRTGALDEVVIGQIRDQSKHIKVLWERRDAIEKSIAEQGKLTEEIKQKLATADTVARLEDIYLPFKPKRKTKASVARDNGLEPLAMAILKQDPKLNPESFALDSLNEKIKTTEEALQGARDIIAEMISEDTEFRGVLRKLFEDKATLSSKLVTGKETEGNKYRDYFEFSEPVSKIPSHRVLAILRGFTEGILRISIEPEEDLALEKINRQYIKGYSPSGEQVKKAGRDAYKRLLQPGLETEFRNLLKQKADEEAVKVFAENLRQLLLSSPLGGKRILAIDPGYRTGCKLVCLDEKGSLINKDLIYIHETTKQPAAIQKVKELIDRYRIEAIAIGDGTGGRETEQLIRQGSPEIPVFLVNEDGASVYSASETAREEFPDEDITVRGAVSIGRRLMDPLAELVKIDPKSIGVGQYQHDVNQVLLKEKLDQTVVHCVNLVGVNLNTAGYHLLQYVSGINSTLARNIVDYREKQGKFLNRNALKEVPRMGEKAFEQCAGFLRIRQGGHPLDASAVHPEAYGLVEQMASELGVNVASLVGNEKLVNQIVPEKFVGPEFGIHTVRDILQELRKPGLDPRTEAREFEFAPIFKIEEVKPGMTVPGIVTNLTRFGAFVDIGVKQDGLVHLSEISHDYIHDPSEKLKLGQKVMVKVVEVDLDRKRISLSIKQTIDLPQHTKATKKMMPGKKESRADMPMEDALAALKKKFGR